MRVISIIRDDDHSLGPAYFTEPVDENWDGGPVVPLEDVEEVLEKAAYSIMKYALDEETDTCPADVGECVRGQKQAYNDENGDCIFCPIKNVTIADVKKCWVDKWTKESKP